jgi:hypothetical protein
MPHAQADGLAASSLTIPIRGFSVGLLGQSTLGGNDHVFGLSAQAK